MMKNAPILIMLALCLAGCTKKGPKTNIRVMGVKDPLISLNGDWKLSMDPPENFQKDDSSSDHWSTIKVPGECAMQGYAIRHDKPFVYKKQFMVPADYQGKNIQLRFDGVYSYARVWVNGQYIRDHSGGFTRWYCNISDAVQPGKINQLTVEVTDKANEISYASGYAKHQIGGILRDVYLTAKPFNHLKFVHVETGLDKNYADAKMTIRLGANTNTPLKVKFNLTDKNGRPVKPDQPEITLTPGQHDKTVTFPVKKPEKWDAEHPVLYTLTYKVFEKDKMSYMESLKIGFREIEIKGNKMLVNGKEIKLRGACRHDINPALGRTTTGEDDLKDVQLAKEANMNFIRTSHYPPSERFLDYCDRYGIYVESETAVCFVSSHRTKAYRPGASQNDPDFTQRYLTQLEEMVENFRNHPSVIIWSVGNENAYGINFRKSYDWIKSNDPSRPVIFSYPGSVPDSVRCYDIVSMHYPSWKGDLDQWGIRISGFRSDTIPVLFDEWAHVPCYNKSTLQEDPNVRNFWGESLDRMWSGAFEADGSLGGAIWGMIDETFMMPDTLPGFNKWWGTVDGNILPPPYESHDVGYGEWGIIDTWRRKKPEFWSTKKAYSPARVLLKRIEKFEDGAPIQIPVYNRFDHTDFNELKIKWEYEDHSGILKNSALTPHSKGILQVPGNHWENGKILYLTFYKDGERLIDTYALPIGKPAVKTPRFEGNSGSLKTSENDTLIHVSGKHFTMNFSKTTGLIRSFSVNDYKIITSGPYINLRTRSISGSYNPHYFQYVRSIRVPDRISVKTSDTLVTFLVRGRYDTISWQYEMAVNGRGQLTINYLVANSINEPIKELGLLFRLTSSFDKLRWERAPYWTAYPETYIGKAGGTSLLFKDKALPEYGKKPEWPWALDTWDIYYLGMPPSVEGQYLTNMAKATKEHIYLYRLENSSLQAGLTILSDGTAACRINREEDGSLLLFVNHLWDYIDISWGNYHKTVVTDSSYSNNILMEPYD